MGIGVYIYPTKTDSSLVKIDFSLKESRWQTTATLASFLPEIKSIMKEN